MKLLLCVALGGGIGAAARYLASSQISGWLGTAFPWGTFTVNLTGAFVLGALVEIMALVWSPSEAMRAFLVVGILGGFTTFSAFSLELMLFAERGRWELAAAYALGSVALGFGGLFLGLRLTRLALQ